MKGQSYKQGVMVSSVEPWWAGLYAPPFDGAQGDTPFFSLWSVLSTHHTFHPLGSPERDPKDVLLPVPYLRVLYERP